MMEQNLLVGRPKKKGMSVQGEIEKILKKILKKKNKLDLMVQEEQIQGSRFRAICNF